MFRYAITRLPAKTFAQGISTNRFGAPDFQRALVQHQAYVQTLQRLGLNVTTMPSDPRYPDSTFIEDVAIVTSNFAVITNPGADSRKGETAAIRPILEARFERLYQITPPGTLDGGDICEAGQHYFIGLSNRTNLEGGRQLAEILKKEGYTSSFIPVEGAPDLLHLKSGMGYLEGERLVVVKELAKRDEFRSYELVIVPDSERYAANCLQVNAAVLLPSGYPLLAESLQRLGYQLELLDMSEFQKMDGGLSCLSLRY